MSDSITDSQLDQFEARHHTSGLSAADLMIQRLENQQQPAMSPPPTSYGLGWDDTNDDLTTNPTSSTPPNGDLSRITEVLNVSLASRLLTLANAFKASRDLSPRTIADIDRYVRATDFEERLFMTFISAVDVRDSLERFVKSSTWVATEGLKKTIGTYTFVFVASASVRSYKGNAIDMVLAAMRDLKVADLPSEKDPASVSTVKSLISTKLSDVRAEVKKAILNSLKPSSKRANIAELADTIISGTVVQHTLQLYVRLAFLRLVMSNRGSGSDYWDRVDEELSTLIEKLKTDERLTMAFNATYEDDKQKHGDPADTRHKVVSPNEAASDFTTIINKHARASSSKKRKLDED